MTEPLPVQSSSRFEAWLDAEVARMPPMAPNEEERFRRAMSTTMAAEFVRLDDLAEQVAWPFRLLARRSVRRAKAKTARLRDEHLWRGWRP